MWCSLSLPTDSKTTFFIKKVLPITFSFFIPRAIPKYQETTILEIIYNKAVPINPTNHYGIVSADSRKYTCFNIFSQNLESFRNAVL